MAKFSVLISFLMILSAAGISELNLSDKSADLYFNYFCMYNKHLPSCDSNNSESLSNQNSTYPARIGNRYYRGIHFGRKFHGPRAWHGGRSGSFRREAGGRGNHGWRK